MRLRDLPEPVRESMRGELMKQRAILDGVIAELGGTPTRTIHGATGHSARRRFSAAARRRMSAGMRKYWAKRKAAKP